MDTKIKLTSQLKNKDFSIICNNCLGGYIYQYYNIEYRTPTLGLFFLSKDYIKFLENIKFYISGKLEFITVKESIYYDNFKAFEENINFPIARLEDVEIFFMHYKNQQEVIDKWYRRINKINWNNLIVIMAENETCDYEVIRKFDSLPFTKKICFTKDEYPDIKSSCCIEEMNKSGAQWTVDLIMNHFNITNFINN